MATFVSRDPQKILKQFDGIGFILWKLGMNMLFLNKDLRYIVEGSETKPTQDANLISKWEEKEGKACSCILLSLSDNVILHVSEAKIENDSWD